MSNLDILLITPNTQQRKIIQQTLIEAGYTNHRTASDDKEAIKVLASTQVDLVICDVELGTLDGWRLARLIRSGALAVEASTPIIMVSSTYSERIAEVTARTFQIDRFLPFKDQHPSPQLIQEIETSNPSQQKFSLLIVEDYPDTVELVKRVLHNRFDIEVATDGKTGLESWLARRHDLILLDVMLPEMSGKDVLHKILEVSPSQSVVMMTARSTPKCAGDLILDGATDFISKPFHTEQLRKVCDIAVQRDDFLTSNKEFAQYQESLFHEKELAQITLESIADGVITTDLSGKINFLNSVAESISGWPLNEAKEKQFHNLLNTPLQGHLHKAFDPIKECLQTERSIHCARPTPFLNREGRELHR